MEDYLQKILRARVYDVAEETTRKGKKLKQKIKKHLVKREDLQPVFSFKLRGAFNRMSQLTKEELNKGVIASSAGTMHRSCLSASFLKCRAVIVCL